MKLLFLIVTSDVWDRSIDKIKKLNDVIEYYKDDGFVVDTALLVKNESDINKYDDILYIKYKYVNQRKQLSKVCDFISETNLDYDWFIKLRPEIELLDKIDFDVLCKDSINARARKYNGPLKIRYGSSIGGIGTFGNKNQFNETNGDGSIKYTETETLVILDDIIYIFHKNVINQGAFSKIVINQHENEWFHTSTWKHRNIKFNVIGINCLFTYLTDKGIENAIKDGGCHWYYSGNIPL